MMMPGRVITFIIHEVICLGFNPVIYVPTSKHSTKITKSLIIVTVKNRTIIYIKEE